MTRKGLRPVAELATLVPAPGAVLEPRLLLRALKAHTPPRGSGFGSTPWPQCNQVMGKPMVPIAVRGCDPQPGCRALSAVGMSPGRAGSSAGC